MTARTDAQSLRVLLRSVARAYPMDNRTRAAIAQAAGGTFKACPGCGRPLRLVFGRRTWGTCWHDGADGFAPGCETGRHLRRPQWVTVRVPVQSFAEARP